MNEKQKIKTIKVKVGHPTNTKGAFSFEIRSRNLSTVDVNTGPAEVHATFARRENIPSKFCSFGLTAHSDNKCNRKYASSVDCGGESNDSMSTVIKSLLTIPTFSARQLLFNSCEDRGNHTSIVFPLPESIYL